MTHRSQGAFLRSFAGCIDTSGETSRHGGIRVVSIMGAGVMGRGIAAANVRAGLSVRISDINVAAAEQCVRQLSDASGGLPPATVIRNGKTMPRVSVAVQDSEIADADLIIEAVAENAAVKSAVLSRIEPLLPDQTMIATNSSSIPIARLATALTQPGRFCGLHFCHPVCERPLVEVVGAGSTTSQTIQRACEYAAAIGMAPIIVRDSPGFLLNRLLVPYMNEALELVLAGAPIGMLDEAALQFGMPLGPLAHFDEFGIDVALAVGRILYSAFPDRIVPSELLIAMYKSGRHGRKTGAGFYDAISAGSSAELAPSVLKIIRDRQRRTQAFSADDITRRLFLPMLLEGVRALEEQLVDNPWTIDAALRDGLGMTSSYRGLFGWADAVGAGTLLEWLKPLQDLGDRFQPTPLLRLRAAEKASFLGSTSCGMETPEAACHHGRKVG